MAKMRGVFEYGSSGTTTTGLSHHALTVPKNGAQTRVSFTMTGIFPPGTRRPAETHTEETTPFTA